MFVGAAPDYAWNSLQLLGGAGVLLCGLLVFVDGMSEQPMILILGPSNCDTQVPYTLEFAGDELFERAQLAAFTIVVAGIIPVTILSRVIRSFRTGKRRGRHCPGRHIRPSTRL